MSDNISERDHDQLAEIIANAGVCVPGPQPFDYIDPDMAAVAVLAAGYHK